MFDLAGKVALVTGGDRGIGRGIALALADAGADVAIDHRGSPQHAEEVAQAVRERGRRAIVVRADVSHADDVRVMVDTVVRQLGRLDILVNNAGVLTTHPFLELEEEDWDALMAVNLKGEFLVAQAAARVMRDQHRGGRIINLASIASGQVGVGGAGIAHYAASKGGVIALTESMAVELGPLGITANAIAPGLIDTDMTSGILHHEAARQGALARIPLGRPGTPQDVAALAVFLASDEAAYCTGATFYVDGGWLAG